jgi:abortive infection Abi-like protein
MEDGIVLNAKTMRLPLDSATHMRDRYERLIKAINTQQAGDICDEAKAFLECIFLTIINNRQGAAEDPSGHPTFPQLFDKACVQLNRTEVTDKILRESKKIVLLIGNIRNNYGSTSHGKDGYDKAAIDLQSATHMAREAFSIAAFMFESHLATSGDLQNKRVNYGDNPDFNEFIDSQSDIIEVLGTPMLPSEVLFNTDHIAYKEQLIEFKQEIEEQYYYDMWLDHESDILRGK